MCTIDSTTGKSRGFYLITKWPNDFSVQCNMNNCKDTNEQNLLINKLLCSSEESLSLFIDNNLLSIIDLTTSIESIIINILQSLTPAVIQLTTKWTFDIMQKYRLNAVSNAKCIQECKCENLFAIISIIFT